MMPDEDVEAMCRFDWAEFCSRRAYENRTQPLPEETIEADSASTLFQKFEQLITGCRDFQRTERLDRADRGRCACWPTEAAFTR